VYERLNGLSGLAHSNVSWTARLEPAAVSVSVCVFVWVFVRVCVCGCVGACVGGWVCVGGRINATASCWFHMGFIPIHTYSRSAVADKRSRREMFRLRFVRYWLIGSGLLE
jgi:hypothetical protein